MEEGEGEKWWLYSETSLSQLSKTRWYTKQHTHARTQLKSSGDSRLIVYLRCSTENWNPQAQIRHQSSSVGCVNKSDYGQNHFPFRIVLSAHSMAQHQITWKVLGTRWWIASRSYHISIAGLLPVEWCHIPLKCLNVRKNGLILHCYYVIASTC